MGCALKLRAHSCANIGDHYKYFFETFLIRTICCKSFVFIMIPDINARTRPTFNASQNENNVPSRINFGKRALSCKKKTKIFFSFTKKCFQWGCYRIWVLQGKRSRLPGIFWIYSRPFWSRRDTWIALHSVLELALNYNVWQVFMWVVHCAWLILFKAHIFLFFWLACVRSFRSHIKVTLR